MISKIKKYLARRREKTKYNRYVKGFLDASSKMVDKKLGITDIVELRGSLKTDRLSQEYVEGFRRACDSAVRVIERKMKKTKANDKV